MVDFSIPTEYPISYHRPFIINYLLDFVKKNLYERENNSVIKFENRKNVHF